MQIRDAAALVGNALDLYRKLDAILQRRSHGMGERHVRDAAGAEERAGALHGAIDEVVDQDERPGLKRLLVRTTGRERHEIRHAELFHRVHVGAVIDFMRWDAVAATVPRQEHDVRRTDPANAQCVGRVAPRGRHGLLPHVFDARQVKYARTADDAQTLPLPCLPSRLLECAAE